MAIAERGQNALAALGLSPAAICALWKSTAYQRAGVSLGSPCLIEVKCLPETPLLLKLKAQTVVAPDHPRLRSACS